LLVGGKMAARRAYQTDDTKAKGDKTTKNGKTAAGGKRGESGSAEGATVIVHEGGSVPLHFPAMLYMGNPYGMAPREREGGRRRPRTGAL
jgi:hypothetical protein